MFSDKPKFIDSDDVSFIDYLPEEEISRDISHNNKKTILEDNKGKYFIKDNHKVYLEKDIWEDLQLYL